MTIKSLIIDDEPLAINLIKNYLDQINNIEIVNTFNNAIDGLNFLKENTIDLIFLDINMPILNGINFIKALENKLSITSIEIIMEKQNRMIRFLSRLNKRPCKYSYTKINIHIY